MQVGRLEPIGIDEAQSADAGAGQVADDRHAQPPATDHQHAAGAQLRLSGGADFLERHLPGVVGDGSVPVRVCVIVVLVLSCGRRTALAVDPAGVAVLVVFLLPDRHTVLDLIDDVPAGEERLMTVSGAHAHRSARSRAR